MTVPSLAASVSAGVACFADFDALAEGAASSALTGPVDVVGAVCAKTALLASIAAIASDIDERRHALISRLVRIPNLWIVIIIVSRFLWQNAFRRAS
ncbi:hypothetical protein FHX57_003083 [Paraburkholderia tropica]|uniref:hypothetical protein n=1 Tax=Paraburkholderia tropica TaxID=92647 RepID=UPI0016177E69|nr:hypothetical protein [Paraburkholderia tropica]MBB3000731.1 hypothetical protein [Paraburkholderia tropica]MBB6320361.1 hypothetical protein [Paraburkholderia tropica]